MNEQEMWEKAWSERLNRHDFQPTKEYSEALDCVEEKGHYKIENTHLKDKLEVVREHTEELVNSSVAKSLAGHFKMIPDPLVHCPSILDIATDDMLVDIAGEFLGCAPAIGTLNLRRSYVTEAPLDATLLFHSDGNSIHFLKFFFYLNDVDMDGGPFTYVEGSHKDIGTERGRLRGFEDKSKWTYDEVTQKYDESRIKFLTGNFGDMVIANTSGMHRGTRVKERERTMLTLNYVIHPEGWDTNQQFKIKQEDADGVPENKQFLLDFLIRV